MAAKSSKADPFDGLFDDASARALSRVGVIDVGSNSIRLVVFDGAARSPAYFYNEKVMAGLGSEMAQTGKLNARGVERGLSAMRRFAALAEGMKIHPLTCVATAAVREAKDGADFRKAVEKETGIKMQVIDGEEEARLSAQGVLLGWPDAKGLVSDIGGNSMELAILDGKGKVGKRVTSPLGPFRLEQIAPEALDAHIHEIMAGLAKKIGTDHERIYLVGGSWRAIARLDMERVGYPLPVLHEYRMSPDAIGETLRYIADADLADLRAATGISASRMDLVPLASKVLAALVEVFAPKEIAVSSYGIREGLLYEHMSATLRRRDPLLESARFTERQMARIPGFGKRLHQFLQPIFADLPEDRQRLFRAACLLHDTAWRTHPDYRAEACFDKVTRANMAALSHPERVYLGVALMNRYKSSRPNANMAAIHGLLTPELLNEAEVMGKALRFGAMFSIKDPVEAGELKLSSKRDELVLTLKKPGRALYGEVAQSRFQSLCKAMGVTGTVR